MADDEYTYLQPGFDPASLTVPRLRSILVAHNVAYPSSAKKSDLIAIFNADVAPQARKLLNVQSRTVRSTRGIVDVPSSQSSTADNDDDEDLADNIAVSATTPARRSMRRTTMRPAAEDIVEPTPRSTRRSFAASSSSTARRASSKHAAVDPEPTPRRTARPSASFQTEPSEPLYRDQGADSPFSKDNPFQSGSSPPSAYRTKSSDRRRTTIEPSTGRERRKSRDSRRRTEGYARQDDAIAYSNMPVARVKAEPEFEEEYDVLAGEEFTPEETNELVKSQEENPRTALSRIPRKRRPRSGAAKAAPWTILLTMLVGVAAVWRQEKIKVGFCGIGEPSTALAGAQIPEWASFLRPECEPCPMHAECRENLEVVCDDGFVAKAHPFALGGLVPLPPICRPDSEKLRKINSMTGYAVENILRETSAKYECSEIPSPYVSESTLKATVLEKARNMKDVMDLIDQAIEDIPKRDEVKTIVDP